MSTLKIIRGKIEFNLCVTVIPFNDLFQLETLKLQVGIRLISVKVWSGCHPLTLTLTLVFQEKAKYKADEHDSDAESVNSDDFDAALEQENKANTVFEFGARHLLQCTYSISKR